MDHVMLTTEKLDVTKISNLVANNSCGAISLFVGTTRDNFDSKKVVSLEYEAYESMALKEMRRICTELRSAWSDIVHIAMYHRLGLVDVGEASVVLAISSPHRKSALEATSHALEELKRTVPIWKKERYDDDNSFWKENSECSWLTNRKRFVSEFKSTNCSIASHDKDVSNLVQISAPDLEVERRIQSFIDKKRHENDINNVMDFMGSVAMSTEEQTPQYDCARTNSIVLKQANSRSHLRVRRAKNHIGPQTTTKEYTQALDKHMSSSIIDKDTKLSTTVEHNETQLNERISNIEDYLNLSSAKSSNQTIHTRLKAIENRILFLETVSPEYKHFLTKDANAIGYVKQEYSLGVRPSIAKPAKSRKSYTIKQLDNIIDMYKK